MKHHVLTTTKGYNRYILFLFQKYGVIDLNVCILAQSVSNAKLAQIIWKNIVSNSILHRKVTNRTNNLFHLRTFDVPE